MLSITELQVPKCFLLKFARKLRIQFLYFEALLYVVYSLQSTRIYSLDIWVGNGVVLETSSKENS